MGVKLGGVMAVNWENTTEAECDVVTLHDNLRWLFFTEPTGELKRHRPVLEVKDSQERKSLTKLKPNTNTQAAGMHL